MRIYLVKELWRKNHKQIIENLSSQSFGCDLLATKKQSADLLPGFAFGYAVAAFPFGFAWLAWLAKAKFFKPQSGLKNEDWWS